MRNDAKITQPQTDIDDEIATIRAELQRQTALAETSIRALSERRNSHAPVSRLPNELLCAIFYEIQANQTPTSRWQTVMGVCRKWHAVATTSPSLWTTLVANSDDPWKAELAVSRACNLPLHMLCDFGGNEGCAHVLRLGTQSNNICTIEEETLL